MYLSGIDWAYGFSFVFSVEDYWNIFISPPPDCTAIQIYVPIKKKPKPGACRAKLYPKKIRQLLNRKARLWKRWRVSKDSSAKQAYESYTI